MKEHQRYFPVFSQEDELLPHFVTVRNGNHENLNTVARGNEKCYALVCQTLISSIKKI